MLLLQGQGIGKDLIPGRLYLYKNRWKTPVFVPRKAGETGLEWRLFLEARQQTITYYEMLEREALVRAGKELAALFGTYQIIARDKSFENKVREGIQDAHFTAACAVRKAAEQMEDRLRHLEGEEQRERALDIKNVFSRILFFLEEKDPEEEKTPVKKNPGEERIPEEKTGGEKKALEETKDPGEEKSQEDGTGPEKEETPVKRKVPEEKTKPEEAAWSAEGSREAVILAAREIFPDELLQYGNKAVRGIVMEKGSAYGHTAILAKALGIPMVVGTGDFIREELEGTMVILDAKKGRVLLEAEKEILQKYLEERKAERDAEAAVTAGEQVLMEKIRAAGIRVTCSMMSEDEAGRALSRGADGIGLFRSEGIFLGRDTMPGEEEQLRIYQRVLKTMGGRRTVIRTLDLGADKLPACYMAGKKTGNMADTEPGNLTGPETGKMTGVGTRSMTGRTDALYREREKEQNPALGNRGIRFCLQNPEIFRTQIRALLRASMSGRLAILLPMVCSEWEVREAAGIMEEVKEELRKEGIPFSPDMETGLMIETPASALISLSLGKYVDFFCCGTNDLVQYTLACDRGEPSLRKYYDICHPAVQMLLRMACENGHRNGIRVAVCGEGILKPEMLKVIINLGFDEVVVSPEAMGKMFSAEKV
ncbi:MAG: hypothetical protein IIY55_09340 [Blautia sp.]|nr:hypothetical protein [Blautia sp.]